MRWLLLRGLGRETEHWNGFPGKLQALGHETEFLDLPGAGTEYRRESPLTIHETVEDLRSRRQSAGATGVIAISLGGMVALDWAARYPDEVSHLVVINSSVSGLAPMWKRLRWQSLFTGVKFVTARTIEEKELASLRITTGLRGEALKATARRWTRIRETRPVTTISILRQLFAAFRFRLHVLPECHTLVVKGEHDRLVDPVCSDLIAEKLGARLVSHPTAEHDLPLEDPQWLARTIDEWFRSLASSRPRA